MSHKSLQGPLVLAIFPNRRGFGYALFEDVVSPVDWGMKWALEDEMPARLEQIRLLIHLFQPSVIVLQDCKAPSARCSQRVKCLIESTLTLARRRNVKVKLYSRADIRQCFAYYGARNKDEIARAIAEVLPEFAPRVPPMRKLWMTEDHRMGMFDALSLVFTYYAKEHIRPA